MKHSCRNEWCPSKVERVGQECGACTRSAERTARLMERVEEKTNHRDADRAYTEAVMKTKGERPW